MKSFLRFPTRGFEKTDGTSCPDCASSATTVLTTRKGLMGQWPATLRRRECRDCGERFSTAELTEEQIKKLLVYVA